MAVTDQNLADGDGRFEEPLQPADPVIPITGVIPVIPITGVIPGPLQPADPVIPIAGVIPGPLQPADLLDPVEDPADDPIFVPEENPVEDPAPAVPIQSESGIRRYLPLHEFRELVFSADPRQPLTAMLRNVSFFGARTIRETLSTLRMDSNVKIGDIKTSHLSIKKLYTLLSTQKEDSCYENSIEEEIKSFMKIMLD